MKLIYRETKCDYNGGTPYVTVDLYKPEHLKGISVAPFFLYIDKGTYLKSSSDGYPMHSESHEWKILELTDEPKAIRATIGIIDALYKDAFD